MSVLIYRDQAAIDLRIADIQAKAQSLQAIYSDLKTLGVTTPTLADIKSLQGNQTNLEQLKALVMRGKTLTVSGVAIGAAAIVLDDSLVNSIKSKVGQLKEVIYQFYEIVENEEEELEVAVIEDVEGEIEEGYITYGSELAAEIVEDVTALCVDINAILSKINPDSHSPMRSPEQWLEWNPVTKRFTVDRFEIARRVL